MRTWKKITWAITAAALAGAVALGAVYYNYLTTRKDYPIKNELFRCVETIIEHSEEERDSVVEISEGSLMRKLGGLRNVYIATSKRTIRQDSFQFRLNDSANQTIAAATRKDIKDKGIIQVGRSNLQQLSGTLLENGLQKEVFYIKEHDPEIGHEEWDETFMVGSNDILVNKMTEGRSFSGTLGKQRRSFTFIESFHEGKTPILFSKEAGIIDYFAQGSKVYLFSKRPSISKRAVTFFTKEEGMMYQVSQFFDFARHWNNGGYVLTDAVGEIAKIEIQDFYLFYGDDLVYRYYLDLNGDGDLANDELIGKVLRSESQMDPTYQGSTRTVIYSFMAGHNVDRAYEDFLLCNAIEFAMPDQVNKGMGKDSHIGEIEQRRDDIILYSKRTPQNVHCAVIAEDPLAVGNLAIMFNAAKRPYAKEVEKRLVGHQTQAKRSN